MILPNALLGLVEATLNKHMGNAREAQALLQKINGEHIAIQLTGIGITVHVFVQNAAVRLHNSSDLPPHATLSGSPIDLLTALRTRGFGEGIELEGNTHAIHTLQKALLACDVDMEALLAEHIGDMPARFLGQQAGVVTQCVNRYRSTIDMAVKDYIQEEVQHTPTRIEITNFMDEIDRVRTHADRLLARIQHLSNTTDAPKAKE